MAAQHTPGPWLYGTRDAGQETAAICSLFGVSVLPTEDGKGQGWAVVSADKPCFKVTADEQEANGRLIAAAPELLEAVRGLIEPFADLDTDFLMGVAHDDSGEPTIVGGRPVTPPFALAIVSARMEIDKVEGWE